MPLHLHHEGEDGAALAAAEAVEEAALVADRERRRLLAVERAEADVVAPLPLQIDVGGDDLDDADPVPDGLERLVRDPARHRRSGRAVRPWGGSAVPLRTERRLRRRHHRSRQAGVEDLAVEAFDDREELQEEQRAGRAPRAPLPAANSAPITRLGMRSAPRPKSWSQATPRRLMRVLTTRKTPTKATPSTRRRVDVGHRQRRSRARRRPARRRAAPPADRRSRATKPKLSRKRPRQEPRSAQSRSRTTSATSMAFIATASRLPLAAFRVP